jgi:hypothetical protein
MSELEKLKAELEIEKAKLKALQDQINPPPREPYQAPIDYTQGMSMPKSALEAMVDASRSYIADIRADARKPNPVTQASSSPLTTSTSSAQSQPQKRGTGWIEERPLESPPGLKIIDAMMDAQDARDKAEKELALAKIALSKKAL